MKKFACHYAIVRFLPYPETGEFANVGVVVACPETGFFGFKLLKRKFGRVTKFFDEIGSDICSQSLSLFDRELSRIGAVVKERRQNPDELRSLFNSLVHPREAIIRFSDTSVRLAENPDQIVENLFLFYVERNFVTQEYKELQLVQRVRNVVQGLKLDKPFRQRNLGDELAQASFPLVQMDNQIAIKVIKPFFLAQSSPSKIISHGGAWVDKVQRLRKRNLLPSATLFAIDGPDENQGNRYLAYKEICDDLERLEVEVIRSTQEQRLISFARN
ncbi:MAG: DUF3037 domain-containing protein [Pseudomonadota bacterium]